MARICIDMGHGGKDPGASGKGMTEAKINYNVGMKLKQLLENYGHTVIMTRKGHEFVELLTRSKIANGAKVDLFISIHHNAGGGDGFEIIYKMNCPKSLALAQAVEKEFGKLNNERRIYCKPGNENPNADWYSVLRNSKAPAIITEFAFLDNPNDVLEVDTLEEQWEQAEAIYRAVLAVLSEPKPKIFKLGDKGDTIKMIQLNLTRVGFPCQVDGVFGEQTKAAVILLQTKNKVHADGMVGPVTMKILERGL